MQMRWQRDIGGFQVIGQESKMRGKERKRQNGSVSTMLPATHRPRAFQSKTFLPHAQLRSGCASPNFPPFSSISLFLILQVSPFSHPHSFCLQPFPASLFLGILSVPNDSSEFCFSSLLSCRFLHFLTWGLFDFFQLFVQHALMLNFNFENAGDINCLLLQLRLFFYVECGIAIYHSCDLTRFAFNNFLRWLK